MLIVFFVLTTSFAVSGIPVDLPSGSGSPVEKTPFVITVERNGAVFLDGERMTAEEAAQALSGQADGRPVVVEADRDSAYGRVVEVLDFLKRNGIERLDLAVEDVTVP